jgi:hypothetical protein
MKSAIRIAVAALLISLPALTWAQNKAVGAWDFTTISPEGTFTSQLLISEEDGKLKAVGKSPNGERPYDSIEVNGTKITLVITISYNGSPMTITYNGQITEQNMGGDADFGGLATGTWSALRHKTQ